MPYSFDWVCKDVVKKLQGKDLCPVTRLSDAMKFRQFAILQRTPQSLFWKSEDTPVGYSLLQILEPNLPVPEPEVSAPIPLKHTVSQKLKANTGVNAIAEGSVSAAYAKSCGYEIEVQCTSIPDSNLESLQNRKLLDKEPSFVKDCRMGRKDLYVVTEAFEVTKDTVLEGSSSVDLSGKALIPQVAKAQAQGQWQRETTDSVPIQKGAVVAYKKKQLVIENDTCVLSDTQLKLLAQSMEKRLLLHQLELVKSILQPNFKYPWNIPFTLQPQLLAPLQVASENMVVLYYNMSLPELTERARIEAIEKVMGKT
ncbi:gasdermin-C [Microtus ochrogaster]|uniref:Gasdermin-C n=1 Tax=Microtus ochrogaster TaxID=79684 RepID=A0ABM1ALW8_MICOH|nr:gasdermin-C [Microtus ochrogaster]